MTQINQGTNEIVALDLGNLQTKIKTRKEVLVFPSKLVNTLDTGYMPEKLGDELKFKAQTDNHLRTYQVLNQPDSFLWGTNLDQLHLSNEILDSMGDKNRNQNEIFKNLIQFSLARAVMPLITNKDHKLTIDVVTGMPTADFVIDSDDQVKTLAKLIKGDHSVLIDGQNYSFRVDQLVILPQPAGTMYDLLLDDKGELKDPELLDQKVRIIDIGGGTLILNEFDNFELNINVESTSPDGAQKLYNQIKAHSDEQLNQNLIEKAFRTSKENGGKLLYKRTSTITKDITDEAKPIIRHWTQLIINKINTVFTGSQDFDRTIFTGGSINLIDKDYIDQMIPNAQFVKNGELANVSGFYKTFIAKRIGE